MNAIRTITLDDSPRDWKNKLRDSEGDYWFSGKPRRLRKDDFLFFAYDHHVRAYARVLSISYKPALQKPWIVKVGRFKAVPKDVESYFFRGYPQLRYLDLLGSQYGGAYRKLASRLRKLAADHAP